MSFLLLIGAFEAFFLILLILGKKNKSTSDIYLSVFLGIYGLTLGISYVEIYNYDHNFSYPFFISIEWLLLYFHGPLLWLYVKSLTSSTQKFKLKYLLHVIPFIVAFSIFYYLFLRLPASERIYIFKEDIFKEQAYYQPLLLSVGISLITYNLLGLKLLRKYTIMLKQNFSKIVHIDLHWLRTLIIASIACYVGNVLLYNLDSLFGFFDYKTLMLIAYSWGTVFILFMGYFGLQQGKVFLSLPENYPSSAKTSPPIIETEDNHHSFIKTLSAYMEENKPYLIPEINLAGLSERLSVKPEYLSEILNASLKHNFYDFINKYRIEEFKIRRKLTENDHLSILGLAFECGFNSKAAFYRAFKKFENTVPTAI